MKVPVFPEKHINGNTLHMINNSEEITVED